nr:hypothetical protein CFP56_39880 [Quercus suber]
MLTPREGGQAFDRVARGRLQQSRGQAFTSSPSDDSGVLVTTDAKGCHRIHKEVRAVSETCPINPQDGRAS